MLNGESRKEQRRHSGRTKAGWHVVGALLIPALLLGACSRSRNVEPTTVVARQCLRVTGAEDITFRIPAPPQRMAVHGSAAERSTARTLDDDRGTLRVSVEERGVSLVATLDSNPSLQSESPVDRLGTIGLTGQTVAPQAHTVVIRGQDSPSITGEACISVEVIPPSAPERAQAARDFAAAGRAVHARDWTSAFSAYLDAARRFDHLKLHSESGTARQALAELAYRRLDRKRDAYALAVEALAEFRSAPGGTDPVLLGLLAGLQAKALMDMPGSDLHASAAQIRARLAVARRYYAQSAYGARELPRLDILTGFLEYLLDAPHEARGWFSAAADRCRGLQDWECYAGASQDLAQLAEESNDYTLALSTYAEALRYVRPEINSKLAADIWMNLGRLQGVVGLFSQSERSQAAAMRAFGELGDCRGVRMGLSRLGRLLVQVGSLADGEHNLQRAAAADCAELVGRGIGGAPGLESTPTPDRPLRAGSRPVRLRDLPERLCEHPLDPQATATESRVIVFNSLESLSEALMLEGDVPRASICLEAAQAYADNSRSQIRLANARGSVLLEGNEPQAARAEFERALRIADAARLPPTYEHRGSAQLGVVRSALLAGHAAESLSDAYKALQSSVARGDIEQTITSLRLIAAGQRASGDPAAAVHTLQTAADLIEAAPIDELDGEQRATFLATQHTAFAELTDVFASESANDPSAAWSAFEASERGRARSLRYALNQSTRDASSLSDTPLTARYQQLLRDVVRIDARKETDQGHAAHSGSRGLPDSLISELDMVARRERSPSEPLDRAQLALILQELDATLVEYAVGAHDLFAFVINRGAPHVIRLGDRREVASAAADLLNELRDPEAPIEELRTASRRLAAIVFWPLKPYLSGKRSIFVPDDALHTMPLAVLPWSAESRDDLVLHHLETTIIPSALFLTHVRARTVAHRETPRIGLIGDPVFRISDWQRECNNTVSRPAPSGRTRGISDWTESLPRLPGTRAEVTAIARLARESRPGSRVDTLVGCAAVPAALRRVATGEVDLLHIATHARIDAQRPRLSALALTPEPGSGDTAASAFGLLDILGLKLRSRLVVLSACETSRGRLLPGEGVLGPAQAFLQAGAAAVLASYWRVDDQITSAFMQQFYRNLLTDRLSASAALRKAQLESAASGKSYAWAAFALYGWPDSSL